MIIFKTKISSKSCAIVFKANLKVSSFIKHWVSVIAVYSDKFDSFKKT